MKKVEKLIESWKDSNTTIEIYEKTDAQEITHYKLKIISCDSRRFPVLPGAVHEAKRLLKISSQIGQNSDEFSVKQFELFGDPK